MAKHRVQLFNQSRGVAVDTDATPGATVGVDLRLEDGTVVTYDMLFAQPPAGQQPGGGLDAVYWRTIMEIPPNVTALQHQDGTGLYVLTGPGESATRALTTNTLSLQNASGVSGDPVVDLGELEDAGTGALLAVERDQYGRVAGTKPATITGVEGEVTVEHGDAVGGLPTVGLADVPDEGGGALLRFQRDGKGRVAGTSEATTDDLPEGGNLYFTDERARSAAVTDAIDPLATDTAPSGRAVAEALDGIDLSGYAELSSENDFVELNKFSSGAEFSRALKVGGLEIAPGISVGLISPTDENTLGLMIAVDLESGPYINMAGGAMSLFGPGSVNISGNTSVGFVSGSIITFYAQGGDVWFRSSTLRPFFDAGSSSGGTSLGEPSYRWSEVFAMNGSINTSDAREKTEPRELTEAELAASADIARLPCIFQWLHAIEEKGEGARLHASPTVQSVIAAMEAHGLDPFRYGFVCYDEWDETPEVKDEETGEVTQEHRPAGDRYSLRPTELAHFVMRGLAHRQDELERRLVALEG